MDDKVAGFFLITFGLSFVSYLMMRSYAKGKKLFFSLFGSFFVLNMIHLIYLFNLPKKKWGNLGPAVGYVLATLLEVAILLVIAFIWMMIQRKKNKPQ